MAQTTFRSKPGNPYKSKAIVRARRQLIDFCVGALRELLVLLVPRSGGEPQHAACVQQLDRVAVGRQQLQVGARRGGQAEHLQDGGFANCARGSRHDRLPLGSRPRDAAEASARRDDGAHGRRAARGRQVSRPQGEPPHHRQHDHRPAVE